MQQQIASNQPEVHLQLETSGSCGITFQFSLPGITFLWDSSGRYKISLKEKPGPGAAASPETVPTLRALPDVKTHLHPHPAF